MARKKIKDSRIRILNPSENYLEGAFENVLNSLKRRNAGINFDIRFVKGLNHGFLIKIL